MYDVVASGGCRELRLVLVTLDHVLEVLLHGQLVGTS
jgi:hypothetical protein